MSDSTPNPPAGWYPDENGRTRWWDGTTWGPFKDETPPPDSVAAPPAAKNHGGASGIDIAAIILAVLLAPVGLILGIVAFTKARKEGRSRALAIAAIAVGAFVSAVGIAVVLFIVFVAGQVSASAEQDEFCASTDLQTLYTEWDQISPMVRTSGFGIGRFD